MTCHSNVISAVVDTRQHSDDMSFKRQEELYFLCYLWHCDIAMTCHSNVISATVDTESAQRWHVIQTSRGPVFPEQDEVGQWPKIYSTYPRGDCRLAAAHPAPVHQHSTDTPRSCAHRQVLARCNGHRLWHLPRKWVCVLHYIDLGTVTKVLTRL